MLTSGLVYRSGRLSTGALGNGTSQIWNQWPVFKIVAISVEGGGSHCSALAELCDSAQISNNCTLCGGRQPLQKEVCGDKCGLHCCPGLPSRGDSGRC